jgi:molybdopterin converting factor small subunit
MRVTVEFFAQLGSAADSARRTFELPAGTKVCELVTEVIDGAGPELRRQLLDPAGALRPSVLLFVGDAQVPSTSATVLSDGASVLFTCPLAGG